jgi:hypothetical protein
MRKFIPFVLFFVFAFASMNVNGQNVTIFPRIDDQQLSYANEQFELDVQHEPSEVSVTFSLLEAPSGMSINSSSGLISYTPATIFDGGKVIVKVENATSMDTDTFSVYVTDAVQCPDGAISYWKFDEEDGATSYEDFINANALGVINTAPKDTTGVVDSAKVFSDGTGLKTDDVTMYDWNKSQSFSVEFWMKPATDANNVEVFVGRNEGNGSTDLHWWVGRDADNQIVFALRNSADGTNYEARTTVDPYYPGGITGWHHVVAVRNAEAQNISLYIDNTEIQTTSIDTNNNVLTGAASLDVGYMNNFANPDYIYNGGLDEVILYTKALTTSEIQNRYDTGNNGDPACSPGNFAPLFITEPITEVDEDQPYEYTVAAEDVESAALTYEAPILPSWMSFDPATGILSGTPLNENVGDTLVKLTATDGDDVTIEQQFNLTVNNVNDAPVILTEAVDSTYEDEAFEYQLEYEDVDVTDDVTLSATNLPDWLTFDTSTGLLTGTPTNDNVGVHEFTLLAEDNSGATDELPFSLEVVNINDAPVITGQETLTTKEDEAITINITDLQVTDVDDVFPDDFSLTLFEGDNYTFADMVVTPDLNYNGELTIPVTLSDGDSIVEYDLAVTVEAVNDIPEITSSPALSVDEEQEYSYTVTYTDVEEDPIEIIAETLPEWLTLDKATETVSGTPDDPEVGDHTVELLITDGTDTISDAFQITVAPVNDVPTIDDQVDTRTVYADSVVTISVDELIITDPDNTMDEMSIIIESGLNYNLSGDDAIVPASDFEGSIAVQVKVSDGTAVSDVFDYVMNVQVFVGINSRKFSDDMISDMYPNPAQNKIFFELGTQLEKGAIFEIYSITGNVVESIELENSERIEIDLTDFAKGVYIFNLTNGTTFQTGKFVKN